MTIATPTSARDTHSGEPSQRACRPVLHGTRVVPRTRVLSEFSRTGAPALRALGFRGRRGHLVRTFDRVVQVVELQHSIYGSRVTANLGVTLDTLRPVIRWIAQPAVGPHAHDCARWVRIGMVAAERRDVWWSFEADGSGVERAVESLAEALLEYGVGWLDRAAEPAELLNHALEKLERSKSPIHPAGRWPELRVAAAVAAHLGDEVTADRCCTQARALWEDERARLVAARRAYKARHPRRETSLPRVPDLQRELERLIAPTRGKASPASGRPRIASRSGRR